LTVGFGASNLARNYKQDIAGSVIDTAFLLNGLLNDDEGERG
jgi:hypothetical protein